jgi:hypothetical protein
MQVIGHDHEVVNRNTCVPFRHATPRIPDPLAHLRECDIAVDDLAEPTASLGRANRREVYAGLAIVEFAEAKPFAGWQAGFGFDGWHTAC